MTGSGRLPAWRKRALLMALAFVTSLIAVPVTWIGEAAAETNVTVMYHGAVGGKIAPCG